MGIRRGHQSDLGKRSDGVRPLHVERRFEGPADLCLRGVLGIKCGTSRRTHDLEVGRGERASEENLMERGKILLNSGTAEGVNDYDRLALAEVSSAEQGQNIVGRPDVAGRIAIQESRRGRGGIARPALRQPKRGDARGGDLDSRRVGGVSQILS